ncbi:MAG: TetR/AcrR family transcriptional regulator, partial [Candidatus Binatales bacterium]
MEEEELQGPGLRERKKARLREQIFVTAIKMFRKRGYRATRIEDIVRALEISQPTFFRYFPDKEAVLREVGKRGFGRLVALQKYLLSIDGPSPKRLGMLYSSMARDIEADPHLWRAVVLAGGSDPLRSTDPDFHRLEQTQFRLLRDLIADGQRRGEVTRAFTPQHLAECMEGLAATAIVEWAAELNGSRELS